ncbi:MAG TPA: SDR family oxidoreductase [Streptosporangiaceae bacterium]|nr:SDR family oxidoreductase [Streptosporangiaceae bacterium]
MDGVAIVTGAAHGIGLAVARRLGSSGLTVVAVDVDAATLREAPLPDGAVRLVQDLSDDPVPWVRQVIDEHGVPSVLVNNVAVTDGRSFLELPMAAVEQSVRTTLLGTWALTRAVTVAMVERRVRGSVVFILSLHTTRVRMCPDYSVCKAALRMLVSELASELGPHGIRANAVTPGSVDTWSDRVPDAEELVARVEATVPLGRLGEPDDVAKAVEFLADPDRSGYITGADLVVDGGLDQFNWLHHLYGSAATEQSRTGSATVPRRRDRDSGQ